MTASTARRPGAWLRNRLVDGPDSIGARARTERWRVFVAAFPDIAGMRVLDLGGTTEAWHRAPVRPKSVTVLNLFEPGDSTDDTVVPVLGDACRAADVLRAAGTETDFDLVFSNSLIEHVGGHAQRSNLAQQARALAPYHWVQTPYRYFPVEPHWLFPGMQFLPVTARTAVAKNWPLTHTPPATWEDARQEVQWTELVGVAEMRGYFPDSVIYRERMAGLTKSITAVRSPLPVQVAR